MILFLLWNSSLLAKDLGTYGQAFEIKEDHLLRYMQDRSKNMTEDQLKRIGKTAQPNFKPVKGVAKARTYRRFHFDPTVCSHEDILDHAQAIVIHKGTCVNPLEHVSLPAELLFIDGNDKGHLDWARSQKENAKWILVNGNPFELEYEEQRKIYFDQQGILSRKLAIENIPARVSQKGKLLQIEEIPIESNK